MHTISKVINAYKNIKYILLNPYPYTYLGVSHLPVPIAKISLGHIINFGHHKRTLFIETSKILQSKFKI